MQEQHEMEFTRAPQYNLQTWTLVYKLLIYGAVATMGLLGLLALTLL